VSPGSPGSEAAEWEGSELWAEFDESEAGELLAAWTEVKASEAAVELDVTADFA
jgi:hypothetical protein